VDVILTLQFDREEYAEKAVEELNNRWFSGRPIHAELSPVTDFREACCRQYEMGSVCVPFSCILCYRVLPNVFL